MSTLLQFAVILALVAASTSAVVAFTGDLDGRRRRRHLLLALGASVVFAGLGAWALCEHDQQQRREQERRVDRALDRVIRAQQALYRSRGRYTSRLDELASVDRELPEVFLTGPGQSRLRFSAHAGPDSVAVAIADTSHRSRLRVRLVRAR